MDGGIRKAEILSVAMTITYFESLSVRSKRIYLTWPELGILLREDFYYACHALFDFCEQNEMKYVLEFKPFSSLQKRDQTLSS